MSTMANPKVAPGKQTDIVLSYENTCISYRDFPAVDNLSLSIYKGEAVALCGPNGSGKTTLLKAAGGLIVPTKGSVSLMGSVLNKKNRKNAFRNVGFVFQDSEDQLFCTTVKEDIAFGPTNMGLSESEIKERTEYGLDIMHISHLKNRPVHHLSGGEKKRVAIAGILAMKPPLMIMDEPLSGLDPKTSHELIDSLHRLNDELGYTLIIASHEVDRIPLFAKRVVVLKNGQLFRDGPIEEVFTDIDGLNQANIEAPIITQYFASIDKHNTPASLPLTLDQAFLHKRPSQKP